MPYTKAKIPHQLLDERPVHITYRLAGSLPKSTLEAIRRKTSNLKAQLQTESIRSPELLTSNIYSHKLFKINAQYELDIDQALHAIKDGPFFLKIPQLSKEIIDSWIFLHQEGEIYLYAVCVMGNHVHVLLRASDEKEDIDVGALMNRHKRHTARVCNKLLQRTGLPFWEHMYFDRRVRRGKFERVMWYILNNPVKAELVEDWRDWTGTYLNSDFDSLFR